MSIRWKCPNIRQARSPKNKKLCISCKKDYLPNSSFQKVCVECRDKWYYSKIKTWQQNNIKKVKEYRSKAQIKAYKKDPKKYINASINYFNKRKNIDPLFYQQKLSRQRAWWKYSRPFPNAKCTNCTKSKQEIRIELHHINKNPLNNEPNNIILLCVDCHKNIHIGKHTNYKQIISFSERVKNM